jgi:hypothetical protein
MRYWSRLLITCLIAALIAPMLPVAKPAAEAAPAAPQSSLLDRIIFGNDESEGEHRFQGTSTRAIVGGLGQTARVADPLNPALARGGELIFTMKVDPYKQNYFTMKFWGDDVSSYKSIVYINGEQIGYRREGDYEAINIGNQNYRAGGSTGVTAKVLPNRFYYNTIMLPLELTYGQEAAEITVRTYSQDFLANVTEPSRGYYSGYTHTQAYLDVSGETQGSLFGGPVDTADIVAEDTRTAADKQALIDGYTAGQRTLFNNLSAKVDANSTAKLSIVRYEDELKFYAGCLSYDWCPAAASPALKKAAVERIFKTIDNHVKDYYANTRNVQRGGHQGDWGGYYGALGEALYLIENVIADDAVYGREAFETFLAQPFATGTVEGRYSLAGVDWDGGALSRKEAWERALKANFDFARARLSYIYNQVFYTYEGAWEAHEGLRTIGSEFFEGKERSHQILLEAIGVRPFLGEEVLVGPNGEELDLYHSLFLHDATAVFTEDFEQIVAKGLARSKLDDNGRLVRRLPFGEHFTTITEAGLTRENGYVANYGEATNYLPEYFYKTLGKAGDEALNDEILKMALKNLHARGYTRNTTLDDNCYRIMRMNQVLDERNPAYPGNYGYATRITEGKQFHYASLEMAMARDEERYSGPEWDEYWAYAAEAVGYAQQQIADNQYFNYFNSVMGKNKYDYHLAETYHYISEGRAEFERFDGAQAGVVHPLTDFAYYSEQELDAMGVNPADYEQFAWADVDNFFFSMRDGDTRILGQLNMRNRGFAGNGRLHVMTPEYDSIVQIATNGVFRYDDYYLRMDNIQADFFEDQHRNDGDRPQALAGEIAPITYQPGVGTVSRDNFEADHAYAAHPDLLTARYGEYFLLFNSTREAYGNKQSFEVELPADYGGNDVLDLASGARVQATNGKVTVPAQSVMILKLNETFDPAPKPGHVDFVQALAGNNEAGLTWKTAAGAESYTIKRASNENGPYTVVASGVTGNDYRDSGVLNGNVYYYKVAAVKGNGMGRDSWRAELELSVPASAGLAAPWRADAIGDISAGQSQTADGVVAISGGNGSGFGEGDDYNIYDRDIHDSLHYVHQLLAGNGSVEARIDSHSGAASGIMLRDKLDASARYIYFGADEEGNLVLQNRTRDSRHMWTNVKASPFDAGLLGLRAEEYRYIRLVREYDSHYVNAYVSRDGNSWIAVYKLFTPFPYAIYGGVTAAEAARFGDVRVEESERGNLYPAVKLEGGSLTISWNKPKQAVGFSLYRTYDAAASDTNPELRPGTSEPAADSPWTRIAADAMILSYTDTATPSQGTPYYKVAPIALDGAVGPFSDTVSPPALSNAPEPGDIAVSNRPEGIDDVVTVEGLADGSVAKVYRTATALQPLGMAIAESGSASVRIAQIGSLSGSLYVSAAEPGKLESARTLKSYVGEDGIIQLKVEKDTTLRFSNDNASGIGPELTILNSGANVETQRRYGLLTFNGVPDLSDSAIESVNLTMFRGNQRSAVIQARLLEWDDWAEPGTSGRLGLELKNDYFGGSADQIVAFLNSPSASAPVAANSDYPDYGISGVWSMDVMDTVQANTDDKLTLFLASAGAEGNPLTKEYTSGGSAPGQFAPTLTIVYKLDRSFLFELIGDAEALDEAAYTQASWMALQTKLEAARSVAANESADRAAVYEAALQLQAAMDELAGLPKAWLDGPASLSVKSDFSVSAGLSDHAESFTALDLVMRYNPQQVEFAATADQSGNKWLDAGAIVSTHEGLQIAGAALKPEQGEIRIILVAAQGGEAVAASGPLLTLHGKVKDTVLPGTVGMEIAEFTGALSGSSMSFDVADASWEAVLNETDKAALNRLLAEAWELQRGAQVGSLPGQYPQSAIDALGAAIDAAEAVQADILAGADAVAQAINTLAQAMETFREAVMKPTVPVTPGGPNKQALQQAIAAAELLYDRAVEGVKIGQYKSGAKAGLAAAIADAKGIYGSGSSTQQQVNEAAQNLNRKADEFRKELVSLAGDATRLTVADLSVLARYYGIALGQTGWSEVAAADLYGEGKVTIRTLVALARMVLEEWSNE